MGIGSPGGGPPSTPDGDRELHARLLARDPTAPTDLVANHLEPLVARLGRYFPGVEPHLLETVAGDLLMDLAEAPERYDPARAGLAAYLRMAARGDVLNELRRERRRTGRQAPLEDVELQQLAGYISGGGSTDPAEVVAGAEVLDPETRARIRAEFNELEWEFLGARLAGERRTAVFARVLGIEDRPPAEQEREVKRVKDRLDKRLRRLAPWVRRDAGP